MKLTKTTLKRLIKEELENEIFNSEITHQSMVLESKMRTVVQLIESLTKDMSTDDARTMLLEAQQELENLEATNPAANVILKNLNFLSGPAVLLKVIGNSYAAFDE
jgi:hypothetical protein